MCSFENYSRKSFKSATHQQQFADTVLINAIRSNLQKHSAYVLTLIITPRYINFFLWNFKHSMENQNNVGMTCFRRNLESVAKLVGLFIEICWKQFYSFQVLVHLTLIIVDYTTYYSCRVCVSEFTLTKV